MTHHIPWKDVITEFGKRCASSGRAVIKATTTTMTTVKGKQNFQRLVKPQKSISLTMYSQKQVYFLKQWKIKLCDMFY